MFEPSVFMVSTILVKVGRTLGSGCLVDVPMIKIREREEWERGGGVGEKKDNLALSINILHTNTSSLVDK